MTQILWFQDQEWALREVRGKDRVDFLRRLTTNVIPSTPSPLIHNFFLSVNAKVQAEFWVCAQPEYLALLCPKAQVDSLQECIDRYHFGEDIEVTSPEGSLFVVAGLTEDPPECQTVFSPDPRYGDDCRWCFVEPNQVEAFLSRLEQEGETMAPAESERRRILAGRPKFGVDYDENTLFVEVAQRGDFSETKGCYPGQEIVARVLHRGRLNRHLRGFRSETAIPSSWQLKSDGKEVASVRSTVTLPDGSSLGYLLVRREYGAQGQSLTGVDDQGTEYTLTVTPRTDEVLTGDDE